MRTNISSPFISNTNSVSKLMLKLLIATIPALSVWFYFYGWAAFIQFILCIITCYISEYLVLWLRKKSIGFFIQDGSAMVTAVLIGFAIPPLAPWWLAVCTSAFAILFGKHIYGGLGQNIFNPAMLGYAIALISFPVEFAIWPTVLIEQSSILNFNKAWEIIFSASDFSNTSATILAEWRKKPIPMDINWYEQPSFYINISFLLGGIGLLLWRVISWHIPVGFLLGVSLMAIFSAWQATFISTISYHLLSGATMIGAFFIATDPVSAAASNVGKIFYALFAGLLLVIIRTWGNFPDGLAFAILSANLLVPTLDYYLKPKW